MEQGASRRWVVSACVAAVASVGLAACTPEPVPMQTGAPVTSSATNATLTPTPTETTVSEPTHPPEWERGDDVGAVAAATYFMQLFNYVNATGDLAEWDAISDPACDFCSGTHDDLSAVYETGGHYDGGNVAFSAPEVVGFDTTLRIHAVEFAYSSEGAAVLDSSGAVVRTVAPGAGTIVLEVGFTGEGWLLVGGTASAAEAES